MMFELGRDVSFEEIPTLIMQYCLVSISLFKSKKGGIFLYINPIKTNTHETNQKGHYNSGNKDMMKEKTNQDFNKQKPDPKDPNQKGQNNEAEMERAVKVTKELEE